MGTVPLDKVFMRSKIDPAGHELLPYHETRFKIVSPQYNVFLFILALSITKSGGVDLSVLLLCEYTVAYRRGLWAGLETRVNAGSHELRLLFFFPPFIFPVKSSCSFYSDVSDARTDSGVATLMCYTKYWTCLQTKRLSFLCQDKLCHTVDTQVYAFRRIKRCQ